MKKIFVILTLTIIIFTFPRASWAFDRNAIIRGARTISNANYTYNVITNVINAGPVQIGTIDKNLPAYQQIADITAQIQQLKEKLKNFSVK